MAEKLAKAQGMAEINAKSYETGELVFTPEEIRAALNYDPLTSAESELDDSTGGEPQGDPTDDQITPMPPVGLANPPIGGGKK